jgi:hypothetical protein
MIAKKIIIFWFENNYMHYNQRNKDEAIIMNIKKDYLEIGSEGITEDLPPEEWRIDVINELNKKFGFNRCMFTF